MDRRRREGVQSEEGAHCLTSTAFPACLSLLWLPSHNSRGEVRGRKWTEEKKIPNWFSGLGCSLRCGTPSHLVPGFGIEPDLGSRFNVLNCMKYSVFLVFFFRFTSVFLVFTFCFPCVFPVFSFCFPSVLLDFLPFSLCFPSAFLPFSSSFLSVFLLFSQMY